MKEFVSGYFKNLLKEKLIFLLFGLVLAIGVITKLDPGGILGEDHIYMLLGGEYRDVTLFNLSKGFAILGSWKVLIPATILVVVYGFIRNRRDLSIGFFVACFGGFFLNFLIKSIFRRPRPAMMLVNQSGFSYPSGHAMVNTAVYLFIAYYISNYVNDKYKKALYGVAGIMSVLMSISRVYLGVHYISDVVAGIIGGFMVLLGTVFTLEYIRSVDDSDNN